MKKLHKTILLFYCFLSFNYQHLFSQCASFKWQNPIPNGNDIQNITFTQSNNGFFVTEAGEIFKTVNEGKTWELVYKSTQRLNTMTFYKKTGYAVGWQGEFLRSDDEGDTWNKININSTEPLENIHFIDEFNGFVYEWGGKILKTNDGGKNWTRTVIENDIREIKFINHTIGFGSTTGAVHKTDDGGKSWRKFIFGSQGDVVKFYFLNDSVGFGVGGINTDWPLNHSILIKTIDAGKTWYRVNSGTNGYLHSIYFTSDKIGYCAGGDNTIIKTTDGGENWKEVNTVSGGFGFWFNEITFTNETTGYAAGRLGQILKTENSGLTWASLTNFSISYFTSTDAVNDSVWYLAGEAGSIYKTTDKGNEWSKLNSGTNAWINDMKFVTSDIGYAVGQDSFDGSSIIIKTENAGLSWTKCNSLVKQSLRGVEFINEMHGYAVGAKGVIIKTINKGSNWTVMSSGTTNYLTNVFFTGVDTGYVVGENGIILKTIDGKSWNELPRFTDNWLNTVFFIDKNTGFVAGGNGTLYKTINAGATWSRQYARYFLDIQSVNFYNKNVGFFGGDDGVIFKTVNGGETWVKVFGGGYRTLDIEVFNENELVAVGSGGSIVTLLKQQPPKAPSIIGEIAVCKRNEVYNIQNPIPGIIYQWSLDDGGILKSNGNSCEVDWNKTGTFTLSLIAQNDCGNSQAAFYKIQANVEIKKPTISIQDSLLVTAEGNKYQWYNNDTPIEGAVSSQYKPKVSGSYKVSVGDEKCGMAFSEPYFYSVRVVLSNEDDLYSNFKIYPNPATSNLTISSGLNSKIKKIEFKELSGQAMQVSSYKNAENDLILNLNNYNAGIYIMNIYVGNNLITKKIIVNP